MGHLERCVIFDSTYKAFILMGLRLGIHEYPPYTSCIHEMLTTQSVLDNILCTLVISASE
jgi:hypothetical protein